MIRPLTSRSARSSSHAHDFLSGSTTVLAGLVVAFALFAPDAHGKEQVTVLDHEWRSVEGRHWTIEPALGVVPEDPVATDLAEGTAGSCASPGMVAVAGNMKLDGSPLAPTSTIETLQETSACSVWIEGTSGLRRCAKFDRHAWLAASAAASTKTMRFCIDRFEYPNQRRSYPIIFVTWTEAQSLCKREGKRLCTEAEWTFACEGDEAMPYPYGYERDDSACVIDRPNPAFNEMKLRAPRNSMELAGELDRLWRGEASGARSGCRSPFGVYDLTGNVDEWTSSIHPGEHPPSILKGGYWGRIRARCRPSTRAHGQDFAFYQQGFRCCSEMP